jgi:hypothetical protein
MEPWPHPATSHEFASLFFEYRPVLNAVFLQTGHFGMHFVTHSVVAERPAKKRHHVGISPETPRETKVFFLPGAKDQPVGAQKIH